MARYKPDHYAQIMLIPVSLPQQLVPGTFEYTLHELIEHHLDLSVFATRYHNERTGATALHPKNLLQVILFAYSRGLISSRQMERACHENIVCMALSGGYQPDHSTLAHFVSSMQKEIERIFANILLVCDELHLLGGTHFSLDGVKLSSNASKEWSGTFKELKQKRDKLQAKLHQVIAEHLQQDGLSSAETARRQQQEKRLLHQVERLNQFLAIEKPKEGKAQAEIQSNVTDNQSAKMPTSHGVLQGYNAQAWVDRQHQIIVQLRLSAARIRKISLPCWRGPRKICRRLATSKIISGTDNSRRIAIIFALLIWFYAKPSSSMLTSPILTFATVTRVLLNNHASSTACIPENDPPRKPKLSRPPISSSTLPTRSIAVRTGKN